MKIIEVSQVTQAIATLCQRANFELPIDVFEKVKESVSREENPIAKEILQDMIENATIAKDECIPICQDTGTTVIFAKVGQDIQFQGGSLEEAIQEGVRRGYKEGYLRKSIVSDPLIRKNTGDNTPAIIHYEIVEGDKLELVVAPKGGGSENMSQVRMLTPSQGRDGVIEAVVDVVKKAGPNSCPPLIVGVGIGGNFETCALLAKKALLREVGKTHQEEHIKNLEKEILQRVNALGIGPQGLGGKTTALGVHIETAPTHIASLPVGINLGCHVSRHKKVILQGVDYEKKSKDSLNETRS